MTTCIEWDKAKLKSGYGIVSYKNKTTLAHRVAYCLHRGIDLEDIAGLVVRHTCDNPSCVKPGHLVIGTQQQNIADCVARGRRTSVRKDCRTLSNEDVLAIRSQYVSYPTGKGRGLPGTVTSLAKSFGVTRAAVQDIIARRTYKDI